MKRIAIACSVAAVLGSMSIAGSAASRLDKHVTVTGCVVKGDGGYVLMNPSEPQFSGSSELAPPRGTAEVPIGASVAGRLFYWLDDDGEVKDHAGQKVQVAGELDDDVDLGKVKAEREAGNVELEFKVDGRKITVKVPDTPAAIGTSGITDDERTTEFVVRKIDVKSVKMLASTCQ